MPTELVESLIQLVEESGLPIDRQEPLLDSLLAAYASFARDSWGSGANQLKAFQNKLAAQVATKDEGLAEELTEAAQSIIDWVQARANLHIKRNGPKTLLHWGKGMSQEAGQVHGPWRDRPDMTNPVSKSPDEVQMFYRVRLE